MATATESIVPGLLLRYIVICGEGKEVLSFKLVARFVRGGLRLLCVFVPDMAGTYPPIPGCLPGDD
jgi:hypothetical protein